MKKQVLIVEDDAALARVLSDTLTSEGMDAVSVDRGAGAVAVVKDRAPDAVIRGIMLPEPDRFDLCGLLRQGGRVPVIMLTARVQKADKLRGLDVGADDYISKPFELEELLARVRAVLRRSRPSVERLTLGGVEIDF